MAMKRSLAEIFCAVHVAQQMRLRKGDENEKGMLLARQAVTRRAREPCRVSS